jgi:hypothetical protein
MTVRITDTTMRFRQRAILAVCALAGAILLVLSFLPWLSLHTTGGFLGGSTLNVAGHDVTQLNSSGDGYLVAGLSATIVVSACAALLLTRWRTLFVRTISVAAFVIFGIALFEVTNDWPAEYPYSPTPGSSDIDIAPALWAILVVSALNSGAALALTVLQSDHSRIKPTPDPVRP